MSEKETMLAVATAWASIDGKLQKFEECKSNPDVEEEFGHYEGYISEAAEMIRRLAALGYVVIENKTSPHGGCL